MSTSPFFSGRIPQELYDKAEEYCKETGKKKTELLIEALSTYLNFPVKTQTTNFVPQPAEVTKEMFESLQQQVNKLERLITQNQSNVITRHNNRSNGTITLPDNTVVITDNSHDSSTATSADNTNSSSDNSSDNIQIQLEDPDNSVIVNDNGDNKLESKITDNNISSSDNSSDNVGAQPEKDGTAATVDDNSNDKFKLETIDNSRSDSNNSNDNTHNQGTTTREHPVFQSITSNIVAEKTGLKLAQINSFRGKITKKFNKEKKVLTPKTLLEQPEEIKTNIVITIDNTNYQLFYLGQNPKGENLWTLLST
jgi:hypothetical protein